MLSTIFTLRYAMISLPAILVVLAAVLMAVFPGQTWWLLPAAGLCLASVLLGLHDLRQTRHAVLRNYPVAAHLRFLLEAIRPEMRQYFFEGDKDGAPFPRDKRAIVYQRAKRDLDKRPFGTSTSSNTNGCTIPSPRNPPGRMTSCARPWGPAARNPIPQAC